MWISQMGNCERASVCVCLSVWNRRVVWAGWTLEEPGAAWQQQNPMGQRGLGPRLQRTAAADPGQAACGMQGWPGEKDEGRS